MPFCVCKAMPVGMLGTDWHGPCRVLAQIRNCVLSYVPINNYYCMCCHFGAVNRHLVPCLGLYHMVSQRYKCWSISCHTVVCTSIPFLSLFFFFDIVQYHHVSK